jgi:hypothetical protein
VREIVEKLRAHRHTNHFAELLTRAFEGGRP